MQQETSNCIGNRQTVKESIESRLELSYRNAYPHLEAVAISKQIELDGWEWAQPLHLFEFFQNLPYLVHLYATGDSQLHRKSPNREGINRISPRAERLRYLPPSWSSCHFQTNWARRLEMGPTSSSFQVLLESTSFGSFICNRRLVIAS
jgi:hypothetical protein